MPFVMMARSPLRWLRHVQPTTLALQAVLTAALALRLYGLNWDAGHYLHPDERFIVQYVMIGRLHLAWPPDLDELADPGRSGLNPRSDDPETGLPRNFAYGALPLFVTAAVAEAVSRITGENWHAYDRVYLIGRSISALLDTATVLVVYLLAARAFSRRAALAAAAVAALAPMTIQLAHFFTTDSWLTFFVALCLLWSVRAGETGSRRWFAAAGAAFGLAMATKGSVFTLAGLLVVAAGFDVWRRMRWGERPSEALAAAPERLALAAVSAVASFALFEPYALARPSVYRASLEEQADIVRGLFDVPFTRQYIGTTPIVYQIEQIVRWGFGPVAGLLALIGVPLLALRFFRRGWAGETLVLAWLAGYGLVIALPETKFLRYLAPLVPVLAISAGFALDRLWQLAERLAGRRVAAGLGTAVLVGAALWTASFVSVYAGENPRIEASRWIYAEVPSGSTLSFEYWDDALPKDLAPGLTGVDRQYEVVPVDLYRDYPSLRDLRSLGDVLAREPVTAEVGAALQRDDHAAAAAMLQNDLSLRSLPEDLRQALAARLDLAANDFSPVSQPLLSAVQSTVRSLQAPDEDLGAALVGLGDAIAETAENEAATSLYRKLEQVDYYVLSSNRVATAIPRSPWRYPVQTRFYELLDSGQLGFSLAASFDNYPRLGPVRIPDDAADESFINYDHPAVRIYRKDGLIPKPDYDQLMEQARTQQVSPTRQPPSEKLMLDEPVGELPVVADARWSEILTGHSAIALLAWVALLGLLQIAGWPLAALAFRRFADAGWGFSRLIALLVAAYALWIGASLQIFAFRAAWAAIALLALLLAGWAVRLRWRGGRSAWLVQPAQKKAALAGEVIFWLVFGLFLLYRYLNPDAWHPIWGGEKPMEFAHLNATLRSAHFPPYDPWYAGGYVNYYYYGLYLVAFCIKLTGIPSEIAFNLAQPTVIALLASGGYSLAATLGRALSGWRRGAIPAGALGVLLLVGIGNLDGFFRWLLRPAGSGDGFQYWTWAGSRTISSAITEFPYFTGLYADLHAHVVALPITVLALAAGYALARDPRQFALVVAAPRRHAVSVAVITARFGLLALAVGSLTATNAWDVPTYGALGVVALFMASARIRPWSARLAVWVASSALLGGLAYILFLPFFRHYVALFGSLARTREPTDFWQFGNHLGGLLAITGIGLVVLLVTRHREGTHPLQQPVLPLLVLVALLFARGIVGTSSPDLADALTVAIIAASGLTLGLAAWTGAGGRDRLAGQLTVSRLALLVAAGIALIVIPDGRSVFGLLLLFAATALTVWLHGRSPAERFVGLMIGTAAAVGAGIEIVFLADDLQGSNWERMNTIFKFYNQLWILLAVSAAALVARMLVMAGVTPRPVLATAVSRHSVLGLVRQPLLLSTEPGAKAEATAATPADAGRLWARAGLVVTVMIIIASLFYPVLATGPRLQQRFTSSLGSGTLNGLDWMRYGTIRAETDNEGRSDEVSFQGDLAAIAWFNDQVDGSPVIAEAAIGPYRGNGSRISNATGLPAVIGWDRHERQQRYPEGIEQRMRDVRELYDSPDPATKLEILRRYNVAYVAVGEVEREWRGRWAGDPTVGRYASPEGISAFDGMVGTSLEVAFSRDGTTIYRVLPETTA